MHEGMAIFRMQFGGKGEALGLHDGWECVFDARAASSQGSDVRALVAHLVAVSGISGISPGFVTSSVSVTY